MWFDTALARGPVDFPYPCRNGPGSGASEFARSYSRGQRPRDRPVVAEHPTGDSPLASHRRASRPRLTASFGRAGNIHRAGSVVNREIFPNSTDWALGDAATGDWRLATGDWRLAGTGDGRLPGMGDGRRATEKRRRHSERAAASRGIGVLPVEGLTSLSGRRRSLVAPGMTTLLGDNPARDDSRLVGLIAAAWSKRQQQASGSSKQPSATSPAAARSKQRAAGGG